MAIMVLSVTAIERSGGVAKEADWSFIAAFVHRAFPLHFHCTKASLSPISKTEIGDKIYRVKARHGVGANCGYMLRPTAQL